MSLMLHAGAEACDLDALRAMPTPDRTETHLPIPHCAVVDRVKYALQYYGHDVTEEAYGVTPDGARFFGLLSLRSRYGDYADTVGMRNSHDKRFPIGVSFGSRVFVCDNLAFIGDHVIRRKHTPNAMRDLPGMIAEVIEPLAAQRQRQHDAFTVYRQTRLAAPQVDHGIMQLFRCGAINVTRIADVLEAYEHPPEELGVDPWGEETAWRLFNATTYALTGRVAENPQITTQVHSVIDRLCLA